MPGAGVILAVPQVVENAARVTVGGCFTTTVLVDVKVPHELIAASVIRYVPGLLNKNLGFCDVSLVLFVNTHPEERPQFEGVYETVHNHLVAAQLPNELVVFVATTASGAHPVVLFILNAGTGAWLMQTWLVNTLGPQGLEDVSVTV